MKANAERIEKNTVLLKIEVDAEQFSRAVDKVYRKLVKTVNVPGFRKGKTPKVIFERYVGKSTLHEEAMDAIVPSAYFKAVKETGIEPIDQPKIEIEQVEEGKPVLLKATVQVKPEVKLGQYRGLEAVKPSIKITEARVKDELKRLQERHAQLLTLEEGTVEKGDIAVIDFLGKIDGTPFEGGEAKEYSLEIGSGSFIPGFEDQLIGVSAGETKDIEVAFPDDYHAEKLAGKKAVFTVTVREIKRKELSAIDDEFAKDVSEFDTLEELRKDITNKLKQADENNANYRIRHEVVNKAVANAEVDIPSTMIDSRVEEMVKDLEMRLLNQGVNLESYLNYTKGTLEELKASMYNEAEQDTRTNLVLEAISKLEDIQISDEELDEQINKMATYYRQEPEELRKTLESQRQLGFIKSEMIREKTLQLLVEHAVVHEDTDERLEDTNEQTQE